MSIDSIVMSLHVGLTLIDGDSIVLYIPTDVALSMTVLFSLDYPHETTKSVTVKQ